VNNIGRIGATMYNTQVVKQQRFVAFVYSNNDTRLYYKSYDAGEDWLVITYTPHKEEAVQFVSAASLRRKMSTLNLMQFFIDFA
jgi:hypothetical protein